MKQFLSPFLSVAVVFGLVLSPLSGDIFAAGIESPILESSPDRSSIEGATALIPPGGQLSTKKVIFPSTVYLEKTASGTSLQFDLGFSVNEPCSLIIVLYKYRDQNGKTLLYRRLVNHHIADIERFTAVFDKDNKLRLGDSKLNGGDFCLITHPYGEFNWAGKNLASVECTTYLKGEASGVVDEVVWTLPVETYRPLTKLRLPFKGIWWHLEGHDTFSHHRRVFYKRNTNYFASDFMKLNAGQAIFSGAGTKNKDFFSYNEPIFAAADGIVVRVIDGVEDNPPGGRALGFNPALPEMAGGNTVIIKHGNSMFSYYGHLKTGSLKVKEGKTVKKGEILGSCGNSGNSDAPHLHFHVADKPSLQCLEASGLPSVFEEFKLMEGGNWKTIRGRTLLAGEIVFQEK